MTDEEKKVPEPSSEDEEKSEETEGEKESLKDDSEKPEGSSEEEPSKQDSDQGKQEPDWEQVAKDEKTAREKAEKDLARAAYAHRHKKDQESEDSTDNEPEEESKDSGLTEARLREILAEEREATRNEVLQERRVELARKLAGSEAEAQAILEIRKSRVFPKSLSEEQAMQEAYYIAHGPRIVAKSNELRRSLSGKSSASSGSAEDSHKDPSKTKEPALADDAREVLKRRGYVWTGKYYEKEITEGQQKGRKLRIAKIGDSPQLV